MAAGRVRARIVDSVAVLVLERPPVNALNAAMRKALSEAIGHFQSVPNVAAIVLTSEGAAFSAGIDVREVQNPLATPSLSEVCDEIEALSKPVVVALRGAALAGGCELALAGTARLSAPDVTLGLPQVGLGLPPAVGGIQRLTRLVGPAIAINMLLTGRPVDAAVGLRQGLIDQHLSGDVTAQAVEFAKALVAQQVVAKPAMTRSRHLRNGPKFVSAVKAGRKRAGDSFAKQRMVDSVEAALLLPGEAAVAFERTAYDECLAHPDSRALRHVFIAERSIAPALLSGRNDTARSVTAKGQGLLARLFAAQDRAILAMVRAGVTETEIDAAMLAYGMAVGPFGRTKVRDQPDGASVLRRLVAAVVAEGARCVEQRVVRQASDIDVLSIHGMGWPRDKGGPIHTAEHLGLLRLSNEMTVWAEHDPVWDVPDLLRRAALESGGFAATKV